LVLRWCPDAKGTIELVIERPPREEGDAGGSSNLDDDDIDRMVEEAEANRRATVFEPDVPLTSASGGEGAKEGVGRVSRNTDSLLDGVRDSMFEMASPAQGLTVERRATILDNVFGDDTNSLYDANDSNDEADSTHVQAQHHVIEVESVDVGGSTPPLVGSSEGADGADVDLGAAAANVLADASAAVDGLEVAAAAAAAAAGGGEPPSNGDDASAPLTAINIEPPEEVDSVVGAYSLATATLTAINIEPPASEDAVEVADDTAQPATLATVNAEPSEIPSTTPILNLPTSTSAPDETAVPTETVADESSAVNPRLTVGEKEGGEDGVAVAPATEGGEGGAGTPLTEIAEDGASALTNACEATLAVAPESSTEQQLNVVNKKIKARGSIKFARSESEVEA
jgi:hypothetical protein